MKRDVGRHEGMHIDAYDGEDYDPDGDIVAGQERFVARRSGQEGPIVDMHPDVWDVLVTYMTTSDLMSLRGTARASHRRLKPIADAVGEGREIIDGIRWDGTLEWVHAAARIESLLALRLEVRCDMIKRFAQKGGNAYMDAFGRLVVSSEESDEGLIRRYFSQPSGQFGVSPEQVAETWRHAIDTTKRAVIVAAFSARESIGLSDLYAAEMYAPLFGAVPDPEAHLGQVMACARATLSNLRWMDFLHAIRPLKEIHAAISSAFGDQVIDFVACYPMPRDAILAAMIQDLSGLLRTMQHSMPLRQVCVTRWGIPVDHLVGKIVPRVTQSIADCIEYRYACPRGMDKNSRLDRRRAVRCWGDDDGSFAASLHRSLVTHAAKRLFIGNTPWSALSETMRDALRTQVLSIPLADSEAVGLTGATVLDFWDLYFEIHDPGVTVMTSDAASRMDALPWPLQASLWYILAEKHAHKDGLRFHFLSVDRVDRLCVEALQEGRPQLAVPALQALLLWEVRQAVTSFKSRVKTKPQKAAKAAKVARIEMKYLVCTTAAWRIIEACTPAQRLPYIAELFASCETLAPLGYGRSYEVMMSMTIATFVCDPSSRLFNPSLKIRDVLAQYAGWYLPCLLEIVAHNLGGLLSSEK